MKKNVIRISISIFFFFLIYAESGTLFGISISQLWKMPIVLLIIIYVIKNKKQTLTFNKYAYTYGISKLLNAEIINNPIIAITNFAKFITFPFLYDFVTLKIKHSSTINNILFYISQFVLLSFIPFLFHILPQPNEVFYEDITIQEMMEEAGLTSGLFMRTHLASCIIAICLIILIYKIQSEKLNFSKKTYILTLIGLGLWALITTYARDGWIMFIIGLTILFLRRSHKYIIGLFLMALIGFTSISYLIMTNETFNNRINDKTAKGEKQEIGSGRLIFTKNGIDFWLQSKNIQEILTGKGYEELTKYQKQKTGLKIYCHNGYIDALAQNGLIGFVSIILFTIYVYIYIYKYRHEKHARLAFSIFTMQVIFQLVQGGVTLYTDILYVLILRILILEKQERIQIRKRQSSQLYNKLNRLKITNRN